jgi:uncharacterized ubiquitin-like protein YukD
MAAAKVEIIYEAEATSLKATVNEVNKANSEVVKDAQVSAQKVSDSFKEAGNNIANAFANQKIKTGLDNLNKELKQTSSVVIKSAQDVSKFEDRLRELSVAGQRNTDEFKDIAKAVGEYKSAIIAADRAVELYAKSTDAATGRIGELEDKLYDLALAGQTNTKEFKDIVKEVANVKRAIQETDAQVDALAQRGAKFGAFVQSVELVGSAFQAVEGAAALFGAENEELQKTLVRLQAIMAITSALEQGRAIITEQLAAKTGLATVVQSGYNVVVGTSTGLLKGLRIALAATGIGLFVFGLIALVENFEKVKKALENSIPGFKTVSNAIGGVVDTIKEWVGASGDAERAGAAFDAAAKKQNAATKAIVDGYERRIAVEQAAGRNTTALEIEREEAIIAANKKILKDYQLASTDIIKLNQEQKQAAIETAQAAKDAVDESENNIKVIRATAAKEASDKAKEEAKKRAEAEKKSAEDVAKARENLAKLETDALQAQLDEREKILSESNAKIQELEKAFLESKFAAGSAEEKKLQDAILAIKEQAAKDIAAIDQKALEEKAAKEKEAAEKLAKETSDIRIAGLDAQINAIKTLEVTEGTSLERRIQLIELDSQKRLELAKDNASEIKLINAETEQAIRAERKKSTDEAIDQAFEIAQAVADTLGSIIELQGIQSQKRIEEINAASEAEKLAIEGSTAREVDKQRQLDALNTRTQLKISAEKTKQAKAERAAAIFQATIATAAAVAKALPNPVTAGIALAAGLAQIAIIAATPIPKFKKGGPVGGRSHEAGGTLIEAERGEYVVNKNSVMRNRRELDAINTSSAAFRRLIDERYVRPAILNYAMNNKRDGITVNASLNSKAMERKLDRLNKTMAGKQMIVNINGGDSRYTWQ